MHGVDLEIADREFVVFVGPSGCGKSTLLRMIAGLEDITAGEIAIDGRVVNELDPKDRDVAMVFQDYALYPHMTVFENMAFSLRYRGVDRQEIRRRVDEAARILDIEPYSRACRASSRAASASASRWAAPSCAIPRCSCSTSRCRNLDAKLRVQMRTEIKRLRERVATTTIYVTHDQVEAMTLADRIVILNHGRIEQIGTPEEVYDTPGLDVRRGLHRRAADEPAAGRGAARPPAGHPTTLLVGVRPEHLVWHGGHARRAAARAARRAWSSRSAPTRWCRSMSAARPSSRACRRASCAQGRRGGARSSADPANIALLRPGDGAAPSM